MLDVMLSQWRSPLTSKSANLDLIDRWGLGVDACTTEQG